MEHTAHEAARDLRTRLDALPTAVMIMAPGLKPLVPLIARVLSGFEDMHDRVQILEARMNALEGLPSPAALATLRV